MRYPISICQEIIIIADWKSACHEPQGREFQSSLYELLKCVCSKLLKDNRKIYLILDIGLDSNSGIRSFSQTYFYLILE